MKSIFIFQRDFRLNDNTSLITALKENTVVYPVFIATPEQLTAKNIYKSNNAIQFMIESLIDLNKQLNNKLQIFYGSHRKIISNLLSNNEITSIYYNTDYTPYAKSRDQIIKTIAQDYKTTIISQEDYYLHPIESILTTSNSIYLKFTPYYNKAKKISVPKPIKNTHKNYATHALIINPKYKISLPTLINKFNKKNSELWQNGGRDNVLTILANIGKTNSDYNKKRNYLTYRTTNLSAYIKFGCVSIREVYHAFLDKLGKNNDLIKQLHWRDFYANIMWKYPESLTKSMRYDHIKWSHNNSHFLKWCNGETGFPIIDASMAQLNQTGFMHNRGRLIVSNFLIKILLIDWRKGAGYFARKLYDYCPMQNAGNWQWSAGTASDSKYFRIFNPWLQSQKYDSDAEYIKKYLPQLADVPAKDIHNWRECYQNYPKIRYPKPMIDFDERKKMFVKLI